MIKAKMCISCWRSLSGAGPNDKPGNFTLVRLLRWSPGFECRFCGETKDGYVVVEVPSGCLLVGLEEYDNPVLASFDTMFKKIEDRNIVVDRVEMDEQSLLDLRRSCGDAFDVSTHKEILVTGVRGWMWAAEVVVGKAFGKPRAYGRDELPPEKVLWIRRGWEEAE